MHSEIFPLKMMPELVRKVKQVAARSTAQAKDQ